MSLSSVLKNKPIPIFSPKTSENPVDNVSIGVPNLVDKLKNPNKPTSIFVPKSQQSSIENLGTKQKIDENNEEKNISSAGSEQILLLPQQENCVNKSKLSSYKTPPSTDLFSYTPDSLPSETFSNTSHKPTEFQEFIPKVSSRPSMLYTQSQDPRMNTFCYQYYCNLCEKQFGRCGETFNEKEVYYHRVITEFPSEYNKFVEEFKMRQNGKNYSSAKKRKQPSDYSFTFNSSSFTSISINSPNYNSGGSVNSSRSSGQYGSESSYYPSQVEKFDDHYEPGIKSTSTSNIPSNQIEFSVLDSTTNKNPVEKKKEGEKDEAQLSFWKNPTKTEKLRRNFKSEDVEVDQLTNLKEEEKKREEVKKDEPSDKNEKKNSKRRERTRQRNRK